jgi:hypothetical protein
MSADVLRSVEFDHSKAQVAASISRTGFWISNMSISHVVDLPQFAPEAAKLGEVRGSEMLSFALYTLADIPITDLENLAATLEKDEIIGTEPDEIHLIRLAPVSRLQQNTLRDALDAHIRYSTTHMDELDYFPFGFLAAYDRDWERRGIYLVHIDFEEPFEVTGFRIAMDDVPTAANTLRDDEDGAKQVREMYEMSMSRPPLCTVSRLKNRRAEE